MKHRWEILLHYSYENIYEQMIDASFLRCSFCGLNIRKDMVETHDYPLTCEEWIIEDVIES